MDFDDKKIIVVFDNDGAVKKVSKPGRRVYKGYEDIKRFKNGYGTLVISTNKGVLPNDKAYKLKVGGEVICSIW